MTFSTQIKNEIVRSRPKNDACRRLEFLGILFVCGNVHIGRAAGITLKTENPEVARHAVAIARLPDAFEITLEEKQQEHRRALLYAIQITGPDVLGYLKTCGFIRTDGESISFATALPVMDLSDDEQKRAFLRGCFLGAGSCSNPSGSYAAEIICPTVQLAECLLSLLEGYGLAARISLRRQKHVVYLRDGDSVSGFLALLGSHAAALGMENVRTVKETRNYVNRTTNCENANIDKTVSAACRQKAAIDFILLNNKFSKLPPALKEAAELRLEYPDATLQELADYAGIKKPGMNHRLCRLIEWAEDLEKGMQ